MLVTAGSAINTNDQKKDKRSLLVNKLGTSSYDLSNGLARYPPDLNNVREFENDESLVNTLISAHPSGLNYKGNFDNISSSKLATLDQPAGFVSSVLPTLTHGKIKRFARGRPSDTPDRNVQVPSTELIPPDYISPFVTPTPQTTPSTLPVRTTTPSFPIRTTPFIQIIPKISGSILDVKPY